ncbi:MORN repeat-containing protein 5 [Leptinotarsa decemlineata]|uniref:MORN repeat-containing protein 5 n=1 Tax=Leptinotarsa decemlineata TaxID=7539 RepID=UPI000C255753|nr:MORN repeat-containing protein 5-like [Leptinotarsa decemlineata]
MSKSGSRKLTVDWTKEIHSKDVSFAKLRQRGDVELRIHHGYIQIDKPLEKYVTGSSYEGRHDSLGFAGFGTYKYPHGAVYQGYFKDGQFHGDGTITYPKGQELDGTWLNGKLLSFVYRFADGLEYHSQWNYCQQPDRTFQIECYQGLQPPQKEFLTNSRFYQDIPENCYDTGDGYYEPQNKLIYNFKHRAMRVCRPHEEKIIRKHFRQIADEPVGFRKDLYEYWASGRRREIEKITRRMEKNHLSKNSQK